MSYILWFISHKGRILIQDGPDGPAVPRAESPPLPISGEVTDIGEYRGLPCRAALAAGSAPGWTELDLFEAHRLLDYELYRLAARAVQLGHWRENTRFCPACGSPTARHHSALALACSGCGKTIFPQPTAAVLALVEKGDSILLVRAHNFRAPFYGLVAGYLEAGESLEECVAREVKEETALAVKNIRYFGSEPWPFPNNVMIGFTAEYAGGEIRLQEEELSEAAFFTRAAMPALPPKISLTRRMIDWWVEKE